MFRFSDRVVIKTEINILDTNRASYIYSGSAYKQNNK